MQRIQHTSLAASSASRSLREPDFGKVPSFLVNPCWRRWSVKLLMVSLSKIFRRSLLASTSSSNRSSLITMHFPLSPHQMDSNRLLSVTAQSLFRKRKHVGALPLLELSSEQFTQSPLDQGCLVEVCKDLSSTGGPKAASWAALFSQASWREEVEPDESTPVAWTESHEVSDEESSILNSFSSVSVIFSVEAIYLSS